MTEAQLQQRITDYCDLLRLRWHHETDSRRSKAGYPDLSICGPGGFLFAEIKTDAGRLRPEQTAWLDDLERAGIEAHCWRPMDWPHIEATLRRLADR